MFIGLFATAALLSGTASPQTEQVWSALTGTDTVVMGVERSSLSREGDVVTFQGINAWRENPAAAYAVMSSRLDCKARTIVIGERRSYDADGNELGVFTTESPVLPVEPGSTLSIVASALCEDVWPTGQFSAPTHLEFYQRAMTTLASGR